MQVEAEQLHGRAGRDTEEARSQTGEALTSYSSTNPKRQGVKGGESLASQKLKRHQTSSPTICTQKPVTVSTLHLS